MQVVEVTKQVMGRMKTNLGSKADRITVKDNSTGQIPIKIPTAKKRSRTKESETAVANQEVAKSVNEDIGLPRAMNVISWNCRGLGSSSAVSNLKYVIRRYKPDVLFLFETISYVNKIEELRYLLGFESCFTVNREGLGGGLAILWKYAKKCSIQNYSNNHIDVIVHDMRVGDFNDIRSPDEKKRKSGKAKLANQQFHTRILRCGFGRYSYGRLRFHVVQKFRHGKSNRRKLDRAVANNNWCGLFPNAKEQWHTYVGDHDGIIDKLESYGENMLQWSKENSNKIRNEIESIYRKIVRVRHHVGGDNINYFTTLKRRMNTLLVKDNILWKQRAKVHWYKDGDLNTRFFHISTSTSKKVNTILSLTKDNGEVISSSEGMCKLSHVYFIELFQKKLSSRDRVLQAISISISTEDNVMLTNPFDIAELKEAIFSMQVDKILGQDNFNLGFYHQFWDICRVEIFNARCLWLERGSFPEKLNMTNITLIPKGDSQSTMKYWRPIGLCTVLYIAIAKVLTNRLKRVLNKCIFDNQSAVVMGRYILDNAMAPIEVVHHTKAKTNGKIGDIALKLNINKAYDRIYWDYLKDVLPLYVSIKNGLGGLCFVWKLLIIPWVQMETWWVR
ncbi:uncharacterized protein LOC131634832 [Vicia villosa]|uniref:uncharacterized protein LOC131634832 n=1 Tax=Vicia villosa TaxID=3911 RepID=UPI00273AB817|nr:uncharacterized protein LOC131634832 [Vicia villosa]